MKLRDYMRINVWLLPVLTIILPVILLLFGSTFMTTPNKFYQTQIDGNWSVRDGDFYVENTLLEDINLGRTNKGDVVILESELPTVDVPSATIMFRSLLSVVTVYIDGEPVYEYGRDFFEKGRIIPKHYNFVPIENGGSDTPRKLMIKLEVTEDSAFTGLSPVFYGNRFEVEKTFIQSKRLPLFIGIFLCLFGFLLLTLSSYLFLNHSRDLSLIFSSLISFVLGAYNLAYNDLLLFIGRSESYFNLLEYITLYSIPFAIIAFLVSTHPEINSNLNKVIISINFMYPVVTTLLHLFNIVHINLFLSTMHIMALCEAVIVLPQLVINIGKHYKKVKNAPFYSGLTSETVLVLGLAVFIACSVVDILKYNFSKYVANGGEAYSNIDFMTIGALFFVLCLFVFYFYHGIEHINAAYMKEHLEGLAYTDSLTGLMNRAKCMQYMASLTGKYALISLDMDNLKTVNDTLGHQEGDKMIQSFADILKDAFAGAQLVGRTGGDEFFVAIENPSPNQCEEMIGDLRKRMEEFNKTDSVVKLSASCGFAYNHEVRGNDANAVFVIADNRMYKEKEKHHAFKMDRFMKDLLSDETSAEGGAS